MKVQTICKYAALGATLLYLSAPLVHAQESRVFVAQGEPPIQYMVGGIGKSDAARTRAAGKDYSLRMEFSEHRNNEFVADANLSIANMNGSQVFALSPSACAPIVNVDLPDGTYRVTATHHGRPETRVVTVQAKRGRDLYFHWQGEPSSASAAATGDDQG
jgi:hypothetical protein